MVELRNHAEIIALERRVLRLLCQEPALRELGRSSLQHYRWRDMVHGAVFGMVTSAPRISPEQFRQFLPTRLTNAGFPDFPWEDFFQPHGLSQQETEMLIVTLRLSDV